MVTLENLMAAGMDEAEAKRLLELCQAQESTAAGAETEHPEEPVYSEPEASEEATSIQMENLLLRQRLLETLVRCCGMENGVRPERLDALVRLTDVSKVDVFAADMHEQVTAAVKAALKMAPEIGGGKAMAFGSLGRHPRERVNSEAAVAASFRAGMNRR